MLAWRQMCTNFVNDDSASPILLESSPIGFPSAERRPPRDTAAIFASSGPSMLWISPSCRTLSKQVFPQCSSKPYCRPSPRHNRDGIGIYMYKYIYICISIYIIYIYTNIYIYYRIYIYIYILSGTVQLPGIFSSCSDLRVG